MCLMFSPSNTCSMVLYLTIKYQGECGHIEGQAYTLFYLFIIKICVVWVLGFMCILLYYCIQVAGLAPLALLLL